MTISVLCINLQIKGSDGSVIEHDAECQEYKKHTHDAALERFGAIFDESPAALNNTEAVFWSEPMPANLAELKGSFLAKRLGVNYKKAKCCH